MVRGSLHEEVMFQPSPKGGQEIGVQKVGTHPSKRTRACAKAPHEEELIEHREFKHL